MTKNVKNVLKLNALMMLAFNGLSCTNSLNSQINSQFESSIQSNKSARSHIEWELSDANSIRIFSSLRANYYLLNEDKQKAFQNSVCWGLSELSKTNLMIFQDEIARAENKNIIGSACQVSLAKRIANIAAEQTVHFEYKIDPLTLELNKPIDFKLSTKVIELDRILSTKEMIEKLSDNEIVLTFDDGPEGPATDSILNTLKLAGNAKAMFFTKGAQVELLPEKVIAQGKEGHVVANHSWNHFCLKNSETCFKNNNKRSTENPELTTGPGVLSDDDVLYKQIIPNFEIINRLVHTMAPFFRYPYGEARDTTSKYLKEQGIFEVGWNIDTNDWKKIQNLGLNIEASGESVAISKEEIPFTANDVIESALRQIKQRKKGIILFHDIHLRTAEILPQFLHELYKLNFKVVIFKAPSLDKNFKTNFENQPAAVDIRNETFIQNEF